MTPLGVATGYIALGIGLVILSPLIATIALVEWLTLWRKGRHPSPFVPEHQHVWEDWSEIAGPFAGVVRHRCAAGLCGMGGIGPWADCRTVSHEHVAWRDFKDWSDTMEQGRRLQAKEEEE